MIGIYKFTNKINGKAYIAQSVDIFQRVKDHEHRAFTNYPSNREYNKSFYRALRKYGMENFDFEILEICEQDKLNEREKYYITLYDAYHNGYNETLGGDNIVPPHDGEQHWLSKLTESEVIDIRNRYANHEFKDDVYALYSNKIGTSGFHKIWNGETWKKIHMDVYTPENKEFHRKVRNSHPGKGLSPFSYADIVHIRTELKKGKTEEEIYQEYKNIVKYKQTFHNICTYKTYPWILV